MGSASALLGDSPTSQARRALLLEFGDEIELANDDPLQDAHHGESASAATDPSAQVVAEPPAVLALAERLTAKEIELLDSRRHVEELKLELKRLSA